MSCLQYSTLWLRFTAPVHFGGEGAAHSLNRSNLFFASDTLFSALCHTARQMQDDKALEKLVELAKAEKLLLSDGMPYKNDQKYLPKPYLPVSSDLAQAENTDETQRKAFKKLRWVPEKSMQSLIDANPVFSPAEIDQHFGEEFLAEKVSLQNSEKSEPYSVGLYQFDDDSGLYFLVGVQNEEDKDCLCSLVAWLGSSGMGGKRTAGYGCFELTKTEPVEPSSSSGGWLSCALAKQDSPRKMLLNAALPADNELEASLQDASYGLLRRGGFVQSVQFADKLTKKQTQYFFAAGSTFATGFAGDVYSVGGTGNHPVYRYAKPLFVGVDGG